jgi:hypothetical protein
MSEVKNGNGNGVDSSETTTDAWGSNMPRWVESIQSASRFSLLCCVPRKLDTSWVKIFPSSSRPYGRIYAKMPAARYSSEYNMNHAKRGIALIFNHEHFDFPSLKSR